MKMKFVLGWLSALGVGVLAVSAQEAGDLESLRKQLRQATESFEKAMQEQRRVIDALNEKVQAMERAATNRPSVAEVPAGSPPPVPKAAWSATDPIRVSKGSAYMDLSLDGLFAVGGSTADDLGALQPGGHDPNQRGFTVQNVELAFSGAVDTYFRGQGNLIFAIDPDGETIVELEEAYLETMSLPGNFQVKAGQYFTEFGRHNPTHPHSWGFVDTPLVNARFLGGDGLRNPGGRLSWLMPTPFYSELLLSVQNSQGETAASFRSAGHGHGGEEAEGVPFAYRHPDNDRGVGRLGDMLFSPRYAVSFDLNDAQVLLAGASAAFGPNSRGGEDAGETVTQIYGLDLTWKWKPSRQQGGFPFVTWQTEAMLMRYDAGAFDWDEDGNGAASAGEVINAGTGLPAMLRGETLTDYGFYSQVSYGFTRGWIAGLRFDHVTSTRGDYEKLDLTLDGEALGRDPLRAPRWRLSPNLTWLPTEFSKIRLQYNYDDRDGIGVDHSVWLQFEFSLGAHAAHKF